jgi:hypothetical protein
MQSAAHAFGIDGTAVSGGRVDFDSECLLDCDFRNPFIPLAGHPILNPRCRCYSLVHVSFPSNERYERVMNWPACPWLRATVSTWLRIVFQSSPLFVPINFPIMLFTGPKLT